MGAPLYGPHTPLALAACPSHTARCKWLQEDMEEEEEEEEDGEDEEEKEEEEEEEDNDEEEEKEEEDKEEENDRDKSEDRERDKSKDKCRKVGRSEYVCSSQTNRKGWARVIQYLLPVIRANCPPFTHPNTSIPTYASGPP